MAGKLVELPGDGEDFITAQQAGKSLGVSATTFRRMLTLPQWSWVKEKRMGKQVIRYCARDVFAMKQLIDREAVVVDLPGPDAQDAD